LIDASNRFGYAKSVIQNFKHKGLKEFFETGTTRGIMPNHARRLKVRLEAMELAEEIEAINQPGWGLHELKGERAGTWSLQISGPWRLTFQFENGHCLNVNYEQYH
jgi:proteic killer suppression protein